MWMKDMMIKGELGFLLEAQGWRPEGRNMDKDRLNQEAKMGAMMEKR
jgi:hypothetical protein